MSFHPGIVAALPMPDVFEFGTLRREGRRVEIAEFPPTEVGTRVKAVPIQAGLDRLGHDGTLLPVIRRITQTRIVVPISAVALPPGDIGGNGFGNHGRG